MSDLHREAIAELVVENRRRRQALELYASLEEDLSASVYEAMLASLPSDRRHFEFDAEPGVDALLRTMTGAGDG